MKEVSKLHKKAMELADKGFHAKHVGKTEEAAQFLRTAFYLERQAAEIMALQIEVEPTRSVLLRSAASLALECNELDEAERLVAMALSGNPPEEILDELRALLE